MNNIEVFEAKWEKFEQLLKGQLITQSKKQKLTYPIAKLVLTDAAIFWSSKYDEGGRWIYDYCAADPRKGALVKQILTEDMSFTEEKVKKDMSVVVPCAAALASAGAGFGISTLFNAKLWVKVVSSVVPAVSVFPAVNGAVKAANRKKGSNLIDAYVSQLEKYKNGIISILSD